jgi:hypothetical protein
MTLSALSLMDPDVENGAIYKVQAEMLFSVNRFNWK